jgi:hypothetical protein
MRLFLIAVTLLTVLAFSCDVHKQDPVITTDAKVNFVGQHARALSLTQLVGNSYVSKFEIVNQPGSGQAQIIMDKFMIYTPGTQSNESATLRMLSSDGKLVGTARISFEETQDSCGIVSFTKATISKDSTLRVSLANETSICGKLDYILIGVNGVEPYNGSGFSMGAGDKDGHPLVYLTYTPPAGFVGTSKMLYIVGINVKPEFQSQYSAIEQGWLANSGKTGSNSVFNQINDVSFMFEHFLVSIAEVDVKK